MKIWLTVAEGAEYAGVSRDTIYTACERGELHHAHQRPAIHPPQGAVDRRVARATRTGR